MRPKDLLQFAVKAGNVEKAVLQECAKISTKKIGAVELTRMLPSAPPPARHLAQKLLMLTR